jgi:uncharacterized protein (TIGR03437 family)
MKQLLFRFVFVVTPLLAQPRPLAVAPAASFDREAGVAPESIATAFGAGMATSTAVASGSTLPTELGGVSIAVADSRGVSRAAALFAVFPNQVNFLVPEGTAAGTAVVTLRSGQATFAGNVTVRPVAPALFSADGSGRGAAAATALRVLPSGERRDEPALTFDPDRGVLPVPLDLDAAKGGVYVSLYGSGWRGGTDAVQVTAGTREIPVAGAAAHPVYAGLDQLNIGPLPASLAERDVISLTVRAGGASSNPVALSLLAAPAAGRWGRRADLLEPNSEMSVAEAGGKIYVIGGYPASRVSVRTVQVYDPATNEWKLTTPLPVALNHTVTAAVRGRLYVIGGQPDAGGAGPFVNTVYEYDPETAAWTTRAPMPTARGGGAGAVVNGRIYVAGGRPPRGTDFAVYDPAANTWTTLPEMPTQRNHLAATAVGEKIYVTGGRFAAGFESEKTDLVEVFDTVTRRWSAGAAMPRPRGGVNAVEAHGCIHVFGGEGNPEAPNGVFPDHDVYHPGKNEWYRLNPMPIPVHGVTGAVFLHGLIYLPGGGNVIGGSSGTLYHQVYRPEISCRE